MRREFAPADLGDLGLRHEVNVFLFRLGPAGPEYLLLQSHPRREAVWRPVVRRVDLDEDLAAAALRAVRAETGLDSPFHLLFPGAGVLSTVGDLQLVEWPLGLRVRAVDAARLRPRPSLAAAVWQDFQAALRSLEDPAHRQNLLQVHLGLLAA